MKKSLVFILPCIALFSTYHALAQTSLTDSANRSISIAAARAQYVKNTGAGSFLYNGTAFLNYWNKIVGDPFFMSDNFQDGYVYYDGVQYTGIPLKYDIAHDDLVTKTFAKDADIRLVTEKISSFYIDGHLFVRLKPDSIHERSIHPGFYEKLYHGSVTVYGRYEKKVERSAKAEENISRFRQYDDYYIEKNGAYTHIEGESDLAGAFNDQRSEIKKFLNRREIRFKKDPAGTIVKTAVFYDSLKK